MTCRHPGCERTALPNFTRCDDHVRELVFVAWHRVAEPSWSGAVVIPPTASPDLEAPAAVEAAA